MVSAGDFKQSFIMGGAGIKQGLPVRKGDDVVMLRVNDQGGFEKGLYF